MRDICPGIFSTGGRERIARKRSGVGGGKKGSDNGGASVPS